MVLFYQNYLIYVSSSLHVYIFFLVLVVQFLVSFSKCLCVSAVTHNQSSDGFSLSSVLLELLQRAVEEGKDPESYHQHCFTIT